MRRPLVTMTCALVLALSPVALFAQDPPTQPQDPAPAQPEKEKEVRVPITGEAGVLLYPIKPDQTSAFEELMGKVSQALGRSEDPVRRQQAAGWKVFRSAEPMGENALYVVVIDPAVKAADYDPFVILAEDLGPDVGTPENQEMFKRYTEVFAAGPSRLNLTPLSR